MSIEDGGVNDAVIEDASDEEDELCPICHDLAWERVVAIYPRGTCWVLFCGSCGKPFQKKWTMLP